MLGSLFGFFGVALGAFAAHGLKNILPPEMLAVFETAVRYQMYHAFAIIVSAFLAETYHGAAYAGRLFGIGILLFSGSLYALSITGIVWFGMITPVGGVCFLGGWTALFISALRSTVQN